MITPYYKNEWITLYHNDSADMIKKIQDKFNLIILDPPYFSTHIKSLKDNQWKTEKEYIHWFKNIITRCDDILAQNGAIYIFHNDLEIMTNILYHSRHELGLHLRNHIKWNKFPTHDNFSRVIKTYGKNRNYSQTFTEDIYFITKQGNNIETPFSRILNEQMNNKKLKQKDLAKLCLSKNGKITGWISNKLSGKQIPTAGQWELICKYLEIENTYNVLKQEFENNRYRFNQNYINFNCTITEQKKKLKPYSEIWEYEKDQIKWFYTTKPLKMMENIIKISTNEKDKVLDLFSGSGTTMIACHHLNRNFVGVEVDKNYIDLSIKRLQQTQEGLF